MILVTVGTSPWPFARLICAIDELPEVGEPVVAQCGTTLVRPQRATSFDYVPFSTLEEYVRSASVVVTHGGVGSVALCLRHGHRPVVVPRRQRLGEMIDDHQVSFAQRLSDLDVITLVEDVAELGPAVRAPASPPRPTGLSSTLVEDLVSFIALYAARDRSVERSVRG